MKFSFKSLMMMAAVASLPAFAVPTLRITDCKGNGCGNANDVTVTVTDQLAGDGDLANPGSLVFVGSIGDWSINIVSGTAKPVSGSALAPNLFVSSNNTFGGSGASELLLEFSDDFYTGTPGLLKLGTSSAGTPFNVFSSAKMDPANAIFGGTTAAPGIPEGGPFTGVFSDVRVGASPFNALSPYSLTSMARILYSGTGVKTGTFDMRLEAVPEPGFYGALAIGLSGLFAVVARRRKSSNV